MTQKLRFWPLIINSELLWHGAQAVIAFRYYSTLLYFPNILLKPLKTNV